MGTKITHKTQSYCHHSSAKIMRSYQVVLKCGRPTQRKEINQRIRALEDKQKALLTLQVVKKAVELYCANPIKRTL